MVTKLGERLREERNRMALSQEAFGAIPGVTKQAQIKYEKGERHPDTRYLAAIAAAGADVLYILTGQRSQAVPPTAGLSARQRAVLDNYEHTDEEGKRHIEQAALLAAKSAASAKRGKAA